MILTDLSGLTSYTNYYFFANNKEYRVYTGALTPTFEQLILLMDLELRRDGLTAFAVGPFSNKDIRVANASIKGSGSSIRLASGVSGLDLFASLNGFTALDSPVEGLDVDIQSLIASTVIAPIIVSGTSEFELEVLYVASGGLTTRGIVSASFPGPIYLPSSNVKFFGEPEFVVDRTLGIINGAVLTAGTSEVIFSIDVVGQDGATFAGAAETETADAFITSWKTDEVQYAATATNQIKLPLDTDGTYNFTVDWGDGNSDLITASDQPETTHTYGTASTYTVSIVGVCVGFGFKTENTDNSKLLDIQQWGAVKLHDKGSQFYNCNNLTNISATDEPDLSSNTNLSKAFQNASSLIDGLSGWATNNIQNLSYMFSGCSSFNDDLSSWNTSSATTIDAMFANCANFNSNLPWSTTNVVKMNLVFRGCSNFNGDVSGWDTSNVVSMRSLFEGCPVFNANIGSWKVSNVQNMESMFFTCDAFNQDISSWNTGSVARMGFMFASCTAFNQPIGSWNVSSVINMYSMFQDATSFNQDLSLWSTGSVLDMSYMFRNATNFNGNIATWDTSSVTTMEYMFGNASSFNRDIGGWDVSNVVNMYFMLYQATLFNQDISSWDVGKVEEFGFFFIGSSMSTANYSNILIEWPKLPSLQIFTNIRVQPIQFLPNALPGKTDLLRDYDWSIQDGGVTDTTVFVSRWQTDATGTVTSGTSQIKLPLDSGGVYNFTVEWGDSSSDVITAYNQAAATHTYSAAGTYTITISGQCNGFGFATSGEDNSKLTAIYQWGDLILHNNGGQFQKCNNLEYFDTNDTPDLSSITDVSQMFLDCSSFIGPIDNWDMTAVQNMQSMFENCALYNDNLSGWVTTNATNMSFMFKNATSFNSNLNTWDVASVITMESMFEGASSFDSELNTWNVTSVTTMVNMLAGSGLSIANYSSVLIGWAPQLVQSNVTLDAGTIQYDASATVSRQSLIDTYNWTINDGGEVVGTILMDGTSEIESEFSREADVIALLFSGAIETAFEIFKEAAGGLLFAGQSDYRLVIEYTGQGIHILASTADTELDVNYTANGTMATNGASAYQEVGL